MKKCKNLFIWLYFIALSACGQDKKDTIQHDPIPNQIGTVQVFEVKKDLLAKLPKPNGMINDYAHLFTRSQIATLDSLVRKFEVKSSHEIAVVTLDSTMTNKVDFPAFCEAMIKDWAIGKWDKQNGIIITIAPALRKVQINAESDFNSKLPLDKLKLIIDNVIIPPLKNGDYFSGTEEGIQALIKQITVNGG